MSNRKRISVTQDEKVLQTGCTIWTYQQAWTEHLKMVKIVNFTLCKFYHNQKIKALKVGRNITEFNLTSIILFYYDLMTWLVKLAFVY